MVLEGPLEHSKVNHVGLKTKDPKKLYVEKRRNGYLYALILFPKK